MFLDQEPSGLATAVLNDWSAPGEWSASWDATSSCGWAFHANVVTLTNAKIERFGVIATTRDLTVVRALATRWGS